MLKNGLNGSYKVTVLTGIPNYPNGKFFNGYGFFKKKRELYKGVEIVRVPITPRGKRKFSLAVNYLSFVFSGYIWSFFSRLKPNYVFIYAVSPMTQALPAINFSKKRKIPCYIYVTDLWPESVEVILGLKNKFILKYLDKMVDSIYKGSTKILTSSRSFIDKIGSRSDTYINKLMFWPQYAEDFYGVVEYRNEDVYNKYFKGDNSFKIIFAGNIGEAQNLGILVEVAKKLKINDIGGITLYIVGEGRYRAKLISEVEQNSLQEYFKFIDRQPAENIKYFMYEADVALISLSKSDIFAMTIPAKTQSCLACAIPVLVSADGEIQSIIKKAQAGLCSDANDVDNLYNNILEFSKYDSSQLRQMADNAILYSKTKFDKNKLLDKVDNELFG